MSLKDLDQAIELDDIRTVRQLLFSLSLDKLPETGLVSLLHMAVSVGHVRSVEYLLNRQPYASDADVIYSHLSWTPLMYAVACNDLEIVKYLISSGKCNLKARDATKQTVLHIAASSKDTSKDMLVFLLQQGLDVEAEDSSSMSPFLRAVEANNIELAQTLHALNCNVHKRTVKLETALRLAIGQCDEKTVRWLIKVGCDVNARDSNDQTPLMALVQEKRHPEAILEIMKTLIVSGASVNQQDANGCSIFLHAVSNPLGISKEHLLYLIESGCDIDLNDNTGLTPLWQAVFDSSHYANRMEVIRLLVQYNCHLDKECCGKLLFTSGLHRIYCYEAPLSPFDVALDSSCYETAKFLFMAGCQVRPEIREDYRQISVVPAEVRWLKDSLQNVVCLTQLCRILLRQILGRNIHLKIQCLPFPVSLKAYILLHDLL